MSMAKSASPVRLQEDLMQSATLTGERYHRSAAEQVEYWASIGRRVSTLLDPDVLLSITAGLARLKVEPVYAEAINPETVFQTLENSRKQGALSQLVTSSAIKYQASAARPGYLERIDGYGAITIGQFQHGQFVAIDESGA
jgi:hypothetical protein